MIPVDDDLAIRAALADLTDEQPPPPHDRFKAVRRRAIRHRRRQAAGAAVIAVGAAALVVGLVRMPALQPNPPTTRTVPGWALTWPDHRNRSVPQSVLDRAVLAWQYTDPNNSGPPASGTIPAPATSARQVAREAARYPVVWYVGQTIDHGHQVVVMFEVAGPAGHELVVGQATASEVMQNQPAWSDAASPWVLTSVPAPNPNRPPKAIGEYAPGEPSAIPGRNPDNWMVVLTAPAVQRLTWQATTTSGQELHSDSTSNGLVVADTGQVTAPVELTAIQTAHGNLLGQPVLVGIPGANAATTSGTGPPVPQLAAPPALSEPPSFAMSTGISGQGDGALEDTSFTAGRTREAVFGLCYGPRALVIQINGHTIGTIACDSHTHQLTVPAAMLRGHTLNLYGQTSNLTAWRADIGTLG
ncbi:MAG TPA: hypothetical protein VLM11_04960 [Streptosporangiaceae bacterium]|nr:hypothetical protein [Streptosporangiaceae bacterium]